MGGEGCVLHDAAYGGMAWTPAAIIPPGRAARTLGLERHPAYPAK